MPQPKLTAHELKKLNDLLDRFNFEEPITDESFKEVKRKILKVKQSRTK
jgi:hypothetical protein